MNPVERARELALKQLAYAQEIRTKRARVRRQIKSGEVTAQTIITEPPEEMQSASVSYVLRSCRGAADTRVSIVCRDANVAESKRVGDLTEQQRSRLIEQMANWSCFGGEKR